MENGLQTLNQQKKIALWSERIAACRNSGDTVKAWCQANVVSVASYYKWQKRLFELTSAQQADFAEITPVAASTCDVAVTVRIDGADANIHSGADSETVRTVLQILKSC